MKHLLSVFAWIAISTLSYSQSTETISYVTNVYTNSLEPIANQNIGMRISILEGSMYGRSLYSETHKLTTNENAKVKIEVGGGTPVSGDFSSISWDKGPYFIKSEIDPTGGENYTIKGTYEFAGVEELMKGKKSNAQTNDVLNDILPYSNNQTSTSDDTDTLGPKTPIELKPEPGFTHYVGEQFGGGVIFQVTKDKDGKEHGLVVSLSIHGSDAAWSSVISSALGSAAKNADNGLKNSNAIAMQAGHKASAAKICLDLVTDGQSDWYLPSIDELSALWDNRFAVNQTLKSTKGATPLIFGRTYWSSTEENASYAWYITFQDGNPNYGIKSEKFAVRAIRAF